ncbi:hypothetical protein [Embleya sp. NPDC050493]|uniref:hypothetical protein n=1 Tax=Embleya sp. NPDC050493 TaxID=3363989 RepID=UPI0037B78A0C
MASFLSTPTAAGSDQEAAIFSAKPGVKRLAILTKPCSSGITPAVINETRHQRHLRVFRDALSLHQ